MDLVEDADLIQRSPDVGGREGQRRGRPRHYRDAARDEHVMVVSHTHTRTHTDPHTQHTTQSHTHT